MSKKPASLTSDLLARKGEAEPSSIDPHARLTLSAESGFDPSGSGKAEDEERPLPPEPEIIYTAEDHDGGGHMRLVIGAVLGIAVIGGIFFMLSGKDKESVAPLAPAIVSNAPAPEAGAPSGVLTPVPAGEDSTLRVMPPVPQLTPQEALQEQAAPALRQGGETMTAEAPETAPPAQMAPPAATQPAPAEPVISQAAPVQPAMPQPAAPAAETPKPAPAAAPKPAKAAAKIPGKGTYVVQIVALRDEKSARAAWTTLEKRYPSLLGGHALDIEKADLGEKGTWYRVRAAGFGSKAEAAKTCTALKAKGQDCMVRKR
jgi:cell division septation protein DedD